MITTIAAVVIVVGALLLTFWVRERDLPQPDPVPPDLHLQERKARIYENLRDLQFEYRLGKLSDDDYQRTKKSFQAELAQVLAEIDTVQGKRPAAPKPPASAAATSAGSVTPQPAAATTVPAEDPDPGHDPAPGPAAPVFTCSKCGATFDKPMKFCGECGEVMG